ncbi:MAG TPA: YpdA family putative bacillithiol disulfide reductase, partial [Vicinamibacterales bacterium]|nr:YpdA family putative bacillithiol disulfide reductase [Vicinamibacterales bacterium]
LEQGVLVNSIYRFPPQMVFFTTPELLEIGGVPFMSPYEKPTRAESLNYYRKVVDKYDLSISCDETVTAITPAGAGGGAPPQEERVFAIETRSGRGVTRVRHARFVVLAIGYYDHPVMLGIPGEDLPHVHHFYSEAHVFYRQRVVVVGGGNSAAEAALELYRAGVNVTLVHRHAELKSTIKYWVLPDIMNRIREQSVAARFNTCITEIRPASIIVKGPGGTEEIPADAVLLLTGYRADSDLMARAGVTFTDRGAPHHNVETFETNVPNLFVAGGAIAGEDTGTVFIENGRFHGAKIIEEIARRTTS